MANKVAVVGVNTSKLPKLSNADLMGLLKQVKDGDEFARDKFILANLRLVLSIVQRFCGKKDKADDMFQVGCVGLIKAMNNFNMELNVRFSTYAVPMIIGEIRRYLRDNNSVRVSRSLRDTAYRALQSRQKLSASFDYDPTLDEIANDMNEDVKNVENIDYSVKNFIAKGGYENKDKSITYERKEPETYFSSELSRAERTFILVVKLITNPVIFRTILI